MAGLRRSWRTSEWRWYYVEKEVGGDLFEHGGEQCCDYFVEDAADGVGDVLAVDVVDVELLEDEFGDLLPNLFLSRLICTPLSLSIVHSL